MNCVKKWLALGAAATLLLSAFALSASATQTIGFETDDCLVIATEPGATSQYVTYYKNGEEQPPEKMKWVNDEKRGGKVLSFNGTSDYLLIGYEQLRMTYMTFATWINFQGSADEADPSKAYGQRLFTIESGEDCYLTVSPHMKDSKITKADGTLNGAYAEYFRDDGEKSHIEKLFTGAQADKSHFGLPQNEWHHVAVVVDTTSLKLYIDGNLIDEDTHTTPIAQMSADSMLIGGGLGKWNAPLLHAQVDDMMLFDKALNAQEIAAVMQTGKASSVKNPAKATTTETLYLPTTAADATVSTAPTDQPADKPLEPLGLPMAAFLTGVGLLGVFLALMAVANVYDGAYRRKHGKPVQAKDEDAPAMSIKEAAEQKRREEHERFLNEEKEAAEKGGENE